MTRLTVFLAASVTLGILTNAAAVLTINHATLIGGAQVMRVSATCHAVPLIGPSAQWRTRT